MRRTSAKGVSSLADKNFESVSLRPLQHCVQVEDLHHPNEPLEHRTSA